MHLMEKTRNARVRAHSCKNIMSFCSTVKCCKTCSKNLEEPRKGYQQEKNQKIHHQIRYLRIPELSKTVFWTVNLCKSC